MRGFPDLNAEATQNHVEWRAVQEGFRLLERDLGKLQVHTCVPTVRLTLEQAFYSNLLRTMPLDFARF
jgi:hypothetical protein